MADNWAGLQHDLLFEIGTRLTSIECYESFRAVCRSWRRASAIEEKERLMDKTFQGSWVMLAEKESGMRRFLNISTGKTRKLFLPETSGKYCLSCKDWLLMVDKNNRASLFHLVSRVHIQLPKLTTSPVHNVVLSEHPTSTSDFIVSVIWGNHSQIGFCKPGDASWTAINDWRNEFLDIKYHNNKLYALDCWRRVVRCDVQLQQAFGLSESFEDNNFYVVEFSNRILIVRKTVDCKVNPLKVYEVDMEDDNMVEIKNLEYEVVPDYEYIYFAKFPEIKDFASKTLFLGHNSSVLVDSCPDSDTDDSDGCASNYIYFSVDHEKKYFGICDNELVIYHISSETSESIFDEDDEIVYNKVTPSTWIGPMIY